MNALVLLGILLIGLIVTGAFLAFVIWAWAKLDPPPDRDDYDWLRR